MGGPLLCACGVRGPRGFNRQGPTSTVVLSAHSAAAQACTLPAAVVFMRSLLPPFIFKVGYFVPEKKCCPNRRLFNLLVFVAIRQPQEAVSHVVVVDVVSRDCPRSINVSRNRALTRGHARAWGVKGSDLTAGRTHKSVVYVARVKPPSCDEVGFVDGPGESAPERATRGSRA